MSKDKILKTIGTLIICVFIYSLLDQAGNRLINQPISIYLIFCFMGFFISFIFCWWYFKGSEFYKTIKSFLLVLVVFIPLGFFLSFFLLIPFNLFIIYYNPDNGRVFVEKCKVVNVSSGKNRSLRYRFKRNNYSTKDYYFGDYKDCNNNCYVNVLVKERMFGMFYVLDIHPFTEEGLTKQPLKNKFSTKGR